MKCPECGKGNIRVCISDCDAWGHHLLVCDGCGQGFAMRSGPPFGGGALPPEVPMHKDDGIRVAYESLIDMTDPKEPFLSTLKKAIANAPDSFPLLEDFKRSIAS